MAWFIRKEKGIHTPTDEKMDTPDGMWYKAPSGEIILTKDLKDNCFVVPSDGYHVRIGSKQYFEILFDNHEFEEYNADMSSADPLEFTDTKTYTDRILQSIRKTGLKDAVRTAHGKLSGSSINIACMDFEFIGGSMGTVVGEKISRAIDFSIQNKIPFLMISKSGGARMMESGFSLMQMAKTSAKLALLAKAKVPYISLLTDPTTGGVTASFAMLGDFNIAEPGALIGFAGPRVVRETIGKDLPEGFQTSEFLLEHGFLDFIVDRRELKAKIHTLLRHLGFA
jgi:acetyl-CoA carboxylase carboxyl transferase subunit beta